MAYTATVVAGSNQWLTRDGRRNLSIKYDITGTTTNTGKYEYVTIDLRSYLPAGKNSSNTTVYAVVERVSGRPVGLTASANAANSLPQDTLSVLWDPRSETEGNGYVHVCLGEGADNAWALWRLELLVEIRDVGASVNDGYLTVS